MKLARRLPYYGTIAEKERQKDYPIRKTGQEEQSIIDACNKTETKEASSHLPISDCSLEVNKLSI